MPYIQLHGLGQSASSWARTTDALQIPADDVLCPELSDWLRGHEPRYDGLYQAFTAYCSGFSQPLDLCGLSLGGILALQYAIENSSRVHSLVLIGAQSSMPRRLLRLQNAIFRFLPARAFASTGFGKKGRGGYHSREAGLPGFREYGQSGDGREQRPLVIPGCEHNGGTWHDAANHRRKVLSRAAHYGG